MSRPLSDETLLRTLDDIERYGGISAAARATGALQQTISYHKQEAIRRGLLGGAKEPTWSAPELPSRERPLDELLSARRAEAKRAAAYEEAVRLVRVELKTPGPVGLMVFGDPHIDSPGCAFDLLEAHVALAAARQEYVFAGNIGDVRDNWIGRLSRLYADTTVSARETWRLVEWLMGAMRWVWLVRGNHDAWAGANDPLDWIAKGAGVGIDRDAGVRLAFQHPGGVVTRMHARHDFKGNSEFNPLHALKKELLHGARDHIVVAGHRHAGADAGDVIDGLAVQMVRVSGYKRSDPHAHSEGYRSRPHHPAALIVVDPEAPDDCRSRAWCAPTVEEGVEYLDWRRKRWAKR